MPAAQEVFDGLVEVGEADSVGDVVFVPIATLASGARFGLVDPLRWAVVDGDRVEVFGPGTEKWFVEALEYQRSAFDDELEKGAAARGFDGEAMMFSFPAAELVLAMLASGSPHYTRLALAWLRPTELRDVQAGLKAVIGNRLLPDALRQQAQRMLGAG